MRVPPTMASWRTNPGTTEIAAPAARAAREARGTYPARARRLSALRNLVEQRQALLLLPFHIEVFDLLTGNSQSPGTFDELDDSIDLADHI